MLHPKALTMIRTIYQYMTALAGVLLLAACTADEGETTTARQGAVPVSLTVGVADYIPADGTTRTANDLLSGSTLPSGTFRVWAQSSNAGSNHAKATWDKDGSAITALSLYYPEDGSTAYTLSALCKGSGDAVAAVPLDDPVSPATTVDFTVEDDQSSDGNYKASDLLYAYHAGIASTDRATPQALTFRHMMARVIIEVKSASEVTFSRVTLNGVSRTATVTPMSVPHELLSTTASKNVVKVYSGSDTSTSLTCYALVPPQVLSAATNNLVVVEYDNGSEQTKNFKLSRDLLLSGGYVYTLKITL